jgi:hypothetical protein
MFSVSFEVLHPESVNNTPRIATHPPRKSRWLFVACPIAIAFFFTKFGFNGSGCMFIKLNITILKVRMIWMFGNFRIYNPER